MPPYTSALVTGAGRGIGAAIANCVGAPEHVDVTLMEIPPTLQGIGGIDFHRSGD